MGDTSSLEPQNGDGVRTSLDRETGAGVLVRVPGKFDMTGVLNLQWTEPLRLAKDSRTIFGV